MTSKDKTDRRPHPALPDDPQRTFKRYLITGTIAAVLLLFLNGLLERDKFLHVGNAWQLPAAAVFATIAVAATVMDLTKKHSDSAVTDDYATDHLTQRIRLGKLALDTTGVLAAASALLSLTMLVAAASKTLVEVIVIASAHMIVVGICSLGLDYKQETLLAQKHFEIFQEKYEGENWEREWGLPKEAPEKLSSSWLQTLVTHIIIFVLVLALPYSTFLISPVPYDKDELDTFAILTVLYSLLYVMGLWLMSQQVIEDEQEKRMGQIKDETRSPNKAPKSFLFWLLLIITWLPQTAIVAMIWQIDDVNCSIFALLLTSLSFLVFILFLRHCFLPGYCFNEDANCRSTARLSKYYVRARLKNFLQKQQRKSAEYIARAKGPKGAP